MGSRNSRSREFGCSFGDFVFRIPVSHHPHFFIFLFFVVCLDAGAVDVEEGLALLLVSGPEDEMLRTRWSFLKNLPPGLVDGTFPEQHEVDGEEGGEGKRGGREDPWEKTGQTTRHECHECSGQEQLPAELLHGLQQGEEGKSPRTASARGLSGHKRAFHTQRLLYSEEGEGGEGGEQGCPRKAAFGRCNNANVDHTDRGQYFVKTPYSLGSTPAGRMKNGEQKKSEKQNKTKQNKTKSSAKSQNNNKKFGQKPK